MSFTRRASTRWKPNLSRSGSVPGAAFHQFPRGVAGQGQEIFIFGEAGFWFRMFPVLQSAIAREGRKGAGEVRLPPGDSSMADRPYGVPVRQPALRDVGSRIREATLDRCPTLKTRNYC